MNTTQSVRADVTTPLVAMTASAAVRPAPASRWPPSHALPAEGLDLTASLARNDTHAALATVSDLLVTRPTLTNVNDFRAVLVDTA